MLHIPPSLSIVVVAGRLTLEWIYIPLSHRFLSMPSTLRDCAPCPFSYTDCLSVTQIVSQCLNSFTDGFHGSPSLSQTAPMTPFSYRLLPMCHCLTMTAHHAPFVKQTAIRDHSYNAFLKHCSLPFSHRLIFVNPHTDFFFCSLT